MSNGAVVVVGGGGAVASVFGRSGAVTAQSGDYTAAQVTGAASTSTANTWTATQNFTDGWFINVSPNLLYMVNNGGASGNDASALMSSYNGNATLSLTDGAGVNQINTLASGTAQFTDAVIHDVTLSAPGSYTLRLGAADLNGSSAPQSASTVQVTSGGTNFTGTISSGGTAGLASATVTLAKLTTANGSLTINNGLITAYTAPT